MGKALAILGIFLSLSLIGCGSISSPAADNAYRSAAGVDDYSSGAQPAIEMEETFASSQSKVFGDNADGGAGIGAGAPFAESAPMEPPSPDLANDPLQTTQRRIISTASLSMEVENVQQTANQITAEADALGGFVQQLSSAGTEEHQRANMTIRVPQAQFGATLARVKNLGRVLDENQGSEDVSNQFIDLEARLRSAQREEQSLLSLLERSLKVGDILTIERELNRVRSEIERLQGQINFLERRVELATISIFLTTPSKPVPQPPSGSLVIESDDVTGRLASLRSNVESSGGKVDRVSLSEREGRERADISFRVYPKDFAATVSFLEDLGVVVSKELREGSDAALEEASQPEEPNARIEVRLTEPVDDNVGLILSIAAIVFALIIAGIMALVGTVAYRRGKKRGAMV